MGNNLDRQNRFAWLVVILLFAGSVLNYMDRSVLSVIMPQVRQGLALTNADFGLAINVFLIMYAVFYVLGGRIADILGYRVAFAFMVALWSLAGMAHAFVQGLHSLILCRALLGMAEGGFYPAAMRGIAQWLPPEKRAKGVGLILSSISVGTLLTPPVVAWITNHYGWRPSLLLSGAFGLLLIPPWLLLHRRIHRIFGASNPGAPVKRGPETGASAEHDLSVFEVLKTRKYWFVLGSRASTDAAAFFYLFWIYGYFQDVRKFNLASVGKFLWIPFFVAGIGALTGSWASSTLIRRGLGLDRSRKIILYISASLCIVGASACFAPSPLWALAFVSLALFGQFSWGANIHTVITEITPPRHVAVLYGITGASGTLVGAVTQLAIGHVIDSFGYTPAFVWAGGMYVLAMVLLRAAGTIERIRRNEAVVARVSPPAFSGLG